MNPIAQQDRGARFLLLAASFIVCIAGLRAARTLLLPLLIALFLALISLPLLNWLTKKRFPTWLAVIVTIISALTVFGVIVWVIGGSLAQFTAQVPVYRTEINERMQEAIAFLELYGIRLGDQIDTDLFDPGSLLDVAQTALRRAAAVVSNFALVLLTITFILFEAAGFPDKLREAFGDQSGSERYDRIREQVQRYLATKTLISLATGIAVTIPLWIMGIDFPLLWGLIAFLLNYIPNLGSIIAAIPPVLLALVGKGPGYALGVALVFITVNISFGSFMEPYFMGRRLGMSTLVVFLSLVFWGWVWGPIGMLLSVPLTMIAKIMMENTEDLRWVAVLLSGQPDRRSGD